MWPIVLDLSLGEEVDEKRMALEEWDRYLQGLVKTSTSRA